MSGDPKPNPEPSIPPPTDVAIDPTPVALTPPKPVLKRMRWPFPIVWLVPIIAAIVAGVYMYRHAQDNGTKIAIAFHEIEGIKVNDTPVQYRGVQVGSVVGMELSGDQANAIVRVQLKKSAEAFAKSGARFWLVRPEISADSVAGLTTIVTGPYIQALPGTSDGKATVEFTGFEDPPLEQNPGLRIIVRAEQLEHVQRESPIYYRGYQVGMVEQLHMGSDATHVNVHLVIWPKYAPLIRQNSRFWNMSGADVKGGVFSGLEVKVGTLRSLLVGAIAFATPDTKMGEPARDGESFVLHPEPDKDWLKWSPKIDLNPNLPASPKADHAIQGGGRPQNAALSGQ